MSKWQSQDSDQGRLAVGSEPFTTVLLHRLPVFFLAQMIGCCSSDSPSSGTVFIFSLPTVSLSVIYLEPGSCFHDDYRKQGDSRGYNRKRPIETPAASSIIYFSPTTPFPKHWITTSLCLRKKPKGFPPSSQFHFSTLLGCQLLPAQTFVT